MFIATLINLKQAPNIDGIHQKYQKITSHPLKMPHVPEVFCGAPTWPAPPRRWHECGETCISTHINAETTQQC